MKEQSSAPWGRNRKIAAVAVGLLVVGVGATYTLASWNDSEWVWGGADGDPGIGTSQFEVLQNTDPDVDAAAWTNEEANPGGELLFSPGALQLTPGDTVYAPVALQTDADSVAATVTLQGAVAAAGAPAPANDAALFSAVRATVYTAAGSAAPTACDTGFDATGWTAIVSNATLATAATATQDLDADGASTQHYCFAITLPAGSPDTLQGLVISPAWQFASVSVD
ncbi:SipW-dependent-type signal peptide-containing protein [Microbacterium sp. NPDC055903]